MPPRTLSSASILAWTYGIKQATTRLLQPLAALAIALVVSSHAGAETSSATPTILVFGDSLSAAYGIDENEGWVSLLEARLAEHGIEGDVINGSVSGETTTGGRSRLPSLLRNYQPSHVLLELGGNDGLRGLPLSLMRENLTAMIEMSQEAGARVVIAGMQIPPNYGPRYTQPFFDQYAELAEQYGLYLIPFLIDGIPQQPELMQADGIHPKAEAQVMILDNVWPILLDALN